MSKTVTLRVDDSVYEMFKTAADGQHRNLSNFIEFAVMQYLSSQAYVSENEMDEILNDKDLIINLKNGLADIKKVITILFNFKIAETNTFAKVKSIINPKVYNKIKTIIYPQLKSNPFYGNNIKKLKGEFEGYYRYRIGNYRLFYYIDQDMVIVFIIDFKTGQILINNAEKNMIIHIGAHKTASSMLQNYVFAKHSKELSQKSFFFDPGIKKFGKFLMNSSPLDRKDLIFNKYFFTQMYNQIPEKTIILSSEGFFGKAQANYLNNPDTAKDLKYIFAEFKIKLFVFVRRQDTFIESLYHQYIKEGETKKFSAFINECINIYAFDWEKLVRNFHNEFGDIYVYPYEMLLTDAELLFADISRDLSIPITDLVNISDIPVINTSLTNEGLEILRNNNKFTDQNTLYKIRGELEKKYNKKPGDDFKLLSDLEREEIISFYQKSNLSLFGKYMKNYKRDYYCNLPINVKPVFT